MGKTKADLMKSAFAFSFCLPQAGRGRPAYQARTMPQTSTEAGCIRRLHLQCTWQSGAGTCLPPFGQEKFPVEEITSVAPEQVSAVQWLFDNGYLFAHQFYKTAYVTQAGIRAYQQETLFRKDQLQKQIKERSCNDAAKKNRRREDAE
jgi:hypothetical protein